MILGENIKNVYSYGKEIEKVYSYGKLVWEKQNNEDIDYSTTPFTITAVDNNVSVRLNGSVSFSFKYKKNDSGWLSYNTSEYINLKENDVLYISALPPSNSKVSSVNISGLADVSGNIMSLCYGDDFVGKTELQSSIFSGLFFGCDIRNAKNLILPATTLAYSCYERMFYVCYNLTTAPQLPATTLASHCYDNMFYLCKNLTTPPQLPATNLANNCYTAMFKGCTSLTTAPELPAMTLADTCYLSMFESCTSLTTAPELPAMTLKYYCYSGMFRGCKNLTTPPQLPATNLANNCYTAMFKGCTSLTTAPELPAMTLVDTCYRSMFEGCTSLTTAPELPATNLTDYCYELMFKGCNSLTTAPELPATTLAYYCYNEMFRGCSNLNYIQANFTTTPGSSYTHNWVSGVSTTGTFVKNKNATWDISGVNGIPEGWTIEYI